MAIESKSYTAGNNGGAFQNVDWNALMANQQSEPSPLEQVIDTFKNTNGSFDDKMRRTFDNLNEIEPNFNAQEALRSGDPIQILMDWIEQEEKEEKDQDVVKSADEVLNQLREEQERERIRGMQDDYSQTFTNDELDQMEWRGNPEEIWSIGGKSLSRNKLYNAGKKARDAWNNSDEAKAMSPEDKTKVDQIFSQYNQAVKNGDQARATAAYNHLPASAKAQIDKANSDELGNVISNTVQLNSDKSVDTVVSVSDRSTIYSMPESNSCSSSNLTMGSSCETVINAEIRPTKPFNASASPIVNATEPNIVVANNNIVNTAPSNPKTPAVALEQF